MDEIRLYREDSLLLAEAFDLALEADDEAALNRILSMASDLFRKIVSALQMKYGRESPSGLGGRPSRSWEGWLPADVMADLRNAKAIHEHWTERIKAKVPSLSKKALNEAKRELTKLEADLRARVRDGRRWINERWPGWWTPEVEREFQDWLELG